ncbi:MAG: 16S rRNA (cytidine(1402)-2'-O)-methyltransferase [Pseudomonadota bacterium]
MTHKTLEQNRINLSVRNVIEEQNNLPLLSGLYVVATPIGNLADISLRALSVLARADIIYCEDTRHSRKLLEHYGVSSPLRSYHDYDTEQKRNRIIDVLEKGQSVALISDAGTPLISDPGFKLVRHVIEHGFHIESIPGPSAVLTALTLSGLPTDRFLFEGFLSSKQSQRIKQLKSLKDINATLIFFESARRLESALRDILDVLGNREVVIARELSKKHETLIRGSVEVVLEKLHLHTIKGEIVILTSPPEKCNIDDNNILEALKNELKSNSLRDSVKRVCADFDLPKNRVYNLALTLSK